MIDVEKRALRALEQDAFAFAATGFKKIPGRIHERQDFRSDR